MTSRENPVGEIFSGDVLDKLLSFLKGARSAPFKKLNNTFEAPPIFFPLFIFSLWLVYPVAYTSMFLSTLLFGNNNIHCAVTPIGDLIYV